jgi:hypothetical protein
METTETLDQTPEQVLLENENNRAFLRQAIDRQKSLSKVIPLTTTSADEILRAIESTARQQNITLTLGKTAIVGVTADGTQLGTVALIERALLGTGRNLADGRSTRHIEAADTDTTRDEMTVAQKTAYIAAHGLDAYLKLNAKRKPVFSKSAETLTRMQWLSMPRTERVLLNFSEGQISAIMGRR